MWGAVGLRKMPDIGNGNWKWKNMGKPDQCSTLLPVTLRSASLPKVSVSLYCKFTLSSDLSLGWPCISFWQGDSPALGLVSCLSITSNSFALKIFHFGQETLWLCHYLPFNNGSQREGESRLRDVCTRKLLVHICEVEGLHVCGPALVSWWEGDTTTFWKAWAILLWTFALFSCSMMRKAKSTVRQVMPAEPRMAMSSIFPPPSSAGAAWGTQDKEGG